MISLTDIVFLAQGWRGMRIFGAELVDKDDPKWFFVSAAIGGFLAQAPANTR